MNIIIKITEVYALSEVVKIYYVCYPKINQNSPSASHPDIKESYVFSPNSNFLKFYKKHKNKEITHSIHGLGLSTLDYIYTEKKENCDIEFINRKKIADNSKLKINIIFPKIIKNHGNEFIMEN